MADRKNEGALAAAYAAKRPEEVAALYDRWSDTYDADMSAAGYRHPTICLALLARHLPRGAAPLLDAGAGTGLIGEWLKIAGYPQVEALDIS
ncbi:MAG: SAM-dependent methyltransferase, partial [Mesorhizobium sp.]